MEPVLQGYSWRCIKSKERTCFMSACSMLSQSWVMLKFVYFSQRAWKLQQNDLHQSVFDSVIEMICLCCFEISELKSQNIFLHLKYAALFFQRCWSGAGRNTGRISVPHWQVSGSTPLPVLGVAPAVTAGRPHWRLTKWVIASSHVTPRRQPHESELAEAIEYCFYFPALPYGSTVSLEPRQRSGLLFLPTHPE